MATLTVTITESLPDYNGASNDLSTTNALAISGITQHHHRIVTCPNSATTTIAVFNSAVSGAAGAIDTEDTRYVRVTNISDANLTLAVVGTSDNYQVNLKAGHSHFLSATAAFLLGEADTTPAFGTLEDVASLQVRNVSGAVKQVEILVAGV